MLNLPSRFRSSGYWRNATATTIYKKLYFEDNKTTMMLPKVDAPIYETTLPDSKEKVKYRPYLVREEQCMIVVADDVDADIIATLEQVVASCTFNAIDIPKLSALDMEWLLLQIRIKSKGNDAEISLQCKNIVDGVECNTTNTTVISLKDAMVLQGDAVDDVIQLTDTCGVKMKRMTLAKQLELADVDDSVRDFKTVLASIDQIFFGDEVFLASEIGEEAVEVWLNDLTGNHLEKLVEYVHSAPRIVIGATFTCAKCKYQEEIKIAGIDSFFG